MSTQPDRGVLPGRGHFPWSDRACKSPLFPAVPRCLPMAWYIVGTSPTVRARSRHSQRTPRHRRREPRPADRRWAAPLANTSSRPRVTSTYGTYPGTTATRHRVRQAHRRLVIEPLRVVDEDKDGLPSRLRSASAPIATPRRPACSLAPPQRNGESGPAPTDGSKNAICRRPGSWSTHAYPAHCGHRVHDFGSAFLDKPSAWIVGVSALRRRGMRVRFIEHKLLTELRDAGELPVADGSTVRSTGR